MKKLFALILGLVVAVSAFADIHLDFAYLMKKSSDGSVYIIRVQDDDGKWHDWFVTDTDEPWLFYGYENGERIIVDRTVDIAVIGY